MKLSFLLFLGFSIGLAVISLAQKPLNAPTDTGPKTEIRLIRADSLVGLNFENPTRTFYGNVRFFHRGVFMNCQKAIHNVGSNSIVAYGNILLNQGDTLKITGDTLYYDGNTRIANIYGKKVTLKDKSTVLVSRKVIYELNIDQAYYPVHGVINQDSTELSSDKGYYNTKSKKFKYIGNVQIINPDFVLCSDTLDYDSYTHRADFNSPTSIDSKDGKLTATKGYYYTDSKISRFFGRSKVENKDYSLQADTLDFNTELEEGYGVGKVNFVSFADSILIDGDFGEKKSAAGFTRMIGNAVLRAISDGDTLFLSADTLTIFDFKSPNIKTDSLKADSIKIDSIAIDTPITLEDSLDAPKETQKFSKLIAYGGVKVYRDDFQAVTDSLHYDLIDSVITFIRNPMIWSTDSQLEGDTITAKMVNNKLNTMHLNQKSFIISLDTVKNFNQIKGRDIMAYFDENSQIKKVQVAGNGESIYYALDEGNHTIGLNKVLCSEMTLSFQQKKVKRIIFKGNPESKLIPPVEIKENDHKLDSFDWQYENKPKKEDIIGSKIESKTVEEVE